MLQKPIDRLFKLYEEGLRKTGACLLTIERGSVPEVSQSLRVQGVVHSNSAFNLARVSGPGNKETVPFSISDCRRSTSTAQASSTSGSASNVAISRSTSLALSAAVNCKAAASSVSTVSDSNAIIPSIQTRRKILI